MNDYSGQNYLVWQTSKYTISEFKKLSPKEQLKYFCLTAHLSPSTHNTQPWRFEIYPEKMESIFFVDKKYILPASDVHGRQTIISCGCALKNIEISANYFGYSTEIKILNQTTENFRPNESNAGLIALCKINFFPDEENKDLSELYKAIFKRQVIRAEYDEQKDIPSEVLEKINSIDSGEIKIHLISDRWRRLSISEFQGQADNFVINSKKFSRELGEWLLPNNSENFVGMPGIGFGLSDEEAQRLHLGLKGETPLKPEDGLKFSLGGKIGIEKSPAVCFLTAQEDNIENWLNTGKIMEEIFLELTAQNIAFTVHAGIAEVSLINKLFSMSVLGTTRRIMSLFRIGYTKRPEDKKRPHSPRLPLEKIIINY